MRSYLPIAAAAFVVLLLVGCNKEEPAAAPTPPPVTFASTLEGEALVQHDRLSQEDGLDLRSELTALRVGFLLGIETRYPYGPSFKLEPMGQRFVAQRGLVSKYVDRLRFIAQQLSTKDVLSLERVSTAFFMRHTNPGLSEDQVAREITKVKPHIPYNESLDALKAVAQIQATSKATLT